jgi:hypothetical protein
VLDSKFLAAPTSTPEIEPVEEVVPTVELVEPTATPEPTE